MIALEIKQNKKYSNFLVFSFLSIFSASFCKTSSLEYEFKVFCKYISRISSQKDVQVPFRWEKTLQKIFIDGKNTAEDFVLLNTLWKF